MRILYLCADAGIPIRGHKGAAVHVRALIDAFAALGHEVILLTPRPGPTSGPSPAARLVEVAAADDQSPMAAAEAIYRQAREMVSNEWFDFIYERYSLWSDAGARLARETGLPLVVEVNSPLRAETMRYRAPGLAEAERAAEIETSLLAAASAISVVSGPLRDYVIGRGAPPDRVHVLPNAVDDRYFHPAVDGEALRAKLGLAEKFVVGFVGTVKPWHDLDTLIAAVGRLRSSVTDCHLLLVGDIPAPARETIAGRGLSDSVTIVGPLPHAEVPPCLAAMDVAVSPHPSLEEGVGASAAPAFYFSPLKLFEYLACGVATVAADLPPIAEVVADGVTGLLYPPGDAAALADKIAALAADPALRTHLGWKGASHVLQHHTWEGNARQVIAWLFPLSRNTQFGVSGEGPGLAPARAPALAAGASRAERVRPPLFDDKLRRRLYRATRADVAGPLLAAHLPDGGERGGSSLQVTRLEVLKYKPRRRCVIAYEIAQAQPIIGKVFRDERGARLFALQRALWQNGFRPAPAGEGPRITVAKPLAYVPEMRMFAQERAPGQTLDEFLGAPGFDARVRLSAAAIAKLHAAKSPLKPYPLEAELANLDRFAVELSAWQPDRAEAFARQQAALHAWAATLPTAELVPAHRDFYYSQVLFAAERVTLIDLDMLALADPAIDVANFAAHLRFLALQRLPDPQALDEAAAMFVDEYLRRRRLDAVSEFRARLAFYETATFYRLMHVVLQRPQLVHCFEPLFEIAERELQSAPSHLQSALCHLP